MSDRLENLERLTRLRDAGALSPEEFSAEKAKLLGEDSAAKPDRAMLAEQVSNRRLVMPLKWPVTVAIGTIVAVLLGIGLGYGSMYPDRESIGSGPATPSATPPATGQASVDLDRLLRFTEAKACDLGEGLANLRDDLSEGGAAKPIKVAGADSLVTPTMHLARDGDIEATIASLATPGEWNGLRVEAVRVTSWASNSVNSLQIRFTEPPTKVHRVLAGEGFSLKSIGEFKEVTSGGRTILVGVEDLPNGSALTCAFGAATSGTTGDET